MSINLNTPADVKKYLSDRRSVPTIYIFNDYFHNHSPQSLSSHSEKTNQLVLSATIKYLRNDFETAIRDFREDGLKKIEIAKTVRRKNIVNKYHHERQLVKSKSDILDINRVIALPDDMIRVIFSFCGDDIKVLFNIGRYAGEAGVNLLNSFKKPVLLSFIPYTKPCYLGFGMLPLGKYQQVSLKKKRKSELVTSLHELLSNVEDCHQDVNVITSNTTGRSLPASKGGRVYNAEYYEKNTLLLWRRILATKLKIDSIPKVARASHSSRVTNSVVIDLTDSGVDIEVPLVIDLT
jgi:hypothetical protein